MRKGKIYCPVNGWDCPYYKDGECGMKVLMKGVTISICYGVLSHRRRLHLLR